MSKRHYLDPSYARQLFIEKDGKLYWKNRPQSHFRTSAACKMWNGRFVGTEAGTPALGPRGNYRWVVKVDGIRIYRSRIVWAIRRGMPPVIIDHKNHDTLDDSISNLRGCDASSNCANSTRQKRSVSGAKGVSWDKTGNSWRARITVNKSIIHLGAFDSIDDAKAAYIAAAMNHFGEFAFAG